MRHEGLHMEWSRIWSLLHWKTTIQMKGWIMSLMDDSTQGVTWWLEMVKIASKGFEVLSKGEGWRRKYLHLVEVLIKLWWSHWGGGLLVFLVYWIIPQAHRIYCYSTSPKSILRYRYLFLSEGKVVARNDNKREILIYHNLVYQLV
jgi:hypothetical protein